LGALSVLCVVAAACGGGTATVQPVEVVAESPSPAAGPQVSTVNFRETRPGAGIAAAGGRPQAVEGADPCADPGPSSPEPYSVGYIGPDLAELSDIGFEATVVEDPVIVMAAYLNVVNANGGIGGRCIEMNPHLWSLADPLGSFIEVCASLAASMPIFYFSFQLYDPGLNCATFGTPIPAVGLYTSVPESVIAEARYLLYTDNGSVEHLLLRTAEVGISAGIVDRGTRVGLLHGTGPSAGLGVAVAEGMAAEAGLDIVAIADIPREFGELDLLEPEARVGLLRTDLSDSERAEAEDVLASLPVARAEQLAAVELFFTEAAARFQEAGVQFVVATSHWADVRRMMRAADSIGFTPEWLISDMQPATLTISDAPERQVQNLRQMSARRAAGDLIPALDQGCITMRNTASGSAPFNHRPHTDAWNLITSVCDYLDVLFGALTRVEGPIDHVTILEALNETSYDAEYGGLITFSASDRNGADRHRILSADGGCVLNYWGCMRATTDWLSPAHGMHHHEVGAQELGDMMEDFGHDHGMDSGSETDGHGADEGAGDGDHDMGDHDMENMGDHDMENMGDHDMGDHDMGDHDMDSHEMDSGQ